MIDISDENFKQDVEDAEGLVVIDLYAEWCTPCKMIAPHLEALETELPHVKFGRINVDKEKDLAAIFHVSSIPMIAFVKNNVFLDFLVGYADKTKLKEMILEFI